MGLDFWLSRGGIEYLLIVGSMFDIFYTLSKIYEYFNSDFSVLSNLSLLTCQTADPNSIRQKLLTLKAGKENVCTNQSIYPAPRMSIPDRPSFSQKSEWQYLGNERSYRRSTGGKTSFNRFSYFREQTNYFWMLW